jgi:HEAT repeat protein
MMKDECPYVRRSTIRALRKEPFVKDPRATETLLYALGDTDKVVRAQSVWALHNNASPAIVQAIADVVCDSDNNVSWRAVDALQQIGKPAIGVLAKLLESSDGEIRYQFVKALGKIGGAEALDAIKGSLDDQNHKVRRCAELALQQMKFRNQNPVQLLPGSKVVSWFKTLIKRIW